MGTRLSLLAAALFFAACSTPASRIKRHRSIFDAATPDFQKKIEAGQADVGMTSDEVFLALGKPSRVYTRRTAGAPDQEVWVYGGRGASPDVGFGFGVFSGGPHVGTGVSVGASPGYSDYRGTEVTFVNGRVVQIEGPR